MMDNIQRALNRVASQYGAEIVDVRIKRADLPEGTPLESAYQRMQTARQQEARSIRAQGLKQAQIIRAEADAEAANTYAAAFGKDPDFYDFYRAMQSYESTFVNDGTGKDMGRSSIILSPSNDYLRSSADDAEKENEDRAGGAPFNSRSAADHSLIAGMPSLFCLPTGRQET
jgi:membrane protease subunit HflC